MPTEIKKRGLFYCGDTTCSLAPEIWRGDGLNKRGLCAIHALRIGWVNQMPKPVQESTPPQSSKSFLARLLEAHKHGNVDAELDKLFPMIMPERHWSEYREVPF